MIQFRYNIRFIRCGINDHTKRKKQMLFVKYFMWYRPISDWYQYGHTELCVPLPLLSHYSLLNSLLLFWIAKFTMWVLKLFISSPLLENQLCKLLFIYFNLGTWSSRTELVLYNKYIMIYYKYIIFIFMIYYKYSQVSLARMLTNEYKVAIKAE